MAQPIFHSQYTAAQIEASIGKTPIVDGDTHEWKVWDIATGAYVGTGVIAESAEYADAAADSADSAAASAQAAAESASAVDLGKIAPIVHNERTAKEIEFDDGADDIPLVKLEVDAQPIQAGTGDPSPDNYRALSANNSVTLTANGETITQALPNTGAESGGTYDVLTGDYKPVWILKEFDGTENWVRTASTYPFFRYTLPGLGSGDIVAYAGIFSMFKNIVLTGTVEEIGAMFAYSGNEVRINVRPSNYTITAAAWKSQLAAWKSADTPLVGAYKLSDATASALTAHDISTVLGHNAITVDNGEVTVIYAADTKLYIDGKVNEIMATISNL